MMRDALLSVKASGANRIGTLTLDSYTRTGDFETPVVCLREGQQLNGYPIVSHSVATTQAVLVGVHDEEFPVQVRHGTPQPQTIFQRMIDVGLDATEGGPVSYCLPYGRVPLDVCVGAWAEACHILAHRAERPHVESFGGCLMGQLCPPSLLVAVSVLECLFFKSCGITSVSLSYAQGPSHAQDRAALRILREAAQQLLGTIDWHVVLYTYMGLFPSTEAGASALIASSARLARETGTERMIVKTTAESRQIPTLADNLHALHLAQLAADAVDEVSNITVREQECYEQIKEEVMALLDAVLNADGDLGRALCSAFQHGLLDIPYCLHRDNRGLARSAIDHEGRLVWATTGNLPIRPATHCWSSDAPPSEALLSQLAYVANRYDSSGRELPGAAAG